ncbi:hypothetical protein D3C71_1227720 [compost metagenome]
MTTDKNNTASDPQPAELAEQQVGEVQGDARALPGIVREVLAWYASGPTIWVGWNENGWAEEEAAKASGHFTSIGDYRDGHMEYVPNEVRAEEALIALDEWQASLATRQPGELIAQKVGDYRVTVAEDAITVSHGRDIVFAYSAGDVEPIIARQPGAQEPFGWWLEDANGVGYFSRKMQPAALYAHRTTPGYSATPLHAAPPAQGIDLRQQQDAARWRWVREQNGVTVSVEEADDDGDMAFVSGHTPEELDAAIDGQRDAAPGVGS